MNAVIRRIAVSGGATIALLGGAAATATADTGEHHATVVAIAKADTNLTPNGNAGAPLQNPVTGQQTGYNQQVTTQASGGTMAVGVVAILVLGFIVFVRVKHRPCSASPSPAPSSAPWATSSPPPRSAPSAVSSAACNPAPSRKEKASGHRSTTPAR
jgi:hypothetical protein